MSSRRRDLELEAERTAADYVGERAARALARRGYFREQVARPTSSAASRSSTRYEVRNLGGAVLGTGDTLEDARRRAEAVAPPNYVMEAWLVTSDGAAVKVAQRVRWDAANNRRYWEEAK